MSKLRFTRCITALLLGAWPLLGVVLADLPSEQTWPGDPLPGAHPESSTLPSEAIWPGDPAPSEASPIGSVTPRVIVTPEATPGNAEAESNTAESNTGELNAASSDATAPAPLPTESTWPVGMSTGSNSTPPAEPDSDVVAAAPEVLPDPLVAAQQKAIDERPWLRIQSRGPIAPIRSITFTQDGSRLIAAGEDKHTLIWRRDDTVARDQRWQYERTIRWQVQRGPLGHVFAVCTTPDLLAMAGHGAMGGHAEIWLADPLTGEWRATLVEPDNAQDSRQVITGLQFVPQAETPQLIASDRQGEVTLWTRQADQWERRLLLPDDVKQYGAETAQRLEAFRGFAPIATLDRHVLSARWQSFDAQGTPQWTIVQTPLTSDANQSPQSLTRSLASEGPLHQGFVSAIAVSEQAKLVATCDGVGQLTLWNVSDKTTFKTIQLEGPALTLSFSVDGRRLLVGTGIVAGDKQPSWQIWDTSQPSAARKMVHHVTTSPVRAGSLSPRGDLAAIALQNRVEVHDVSETSVPETNQPGSSNDSEEKQSLPEDSQGTGVQVLRGNIAIPQEVAFPAQKGDYRLRLISQSSQTPDARSIHLFDTRQVQLTTTPHDDRSSPDGTWIAPQQFRGGWSLRKDSRELGLFWLEQTAKPGSEATRRARIVLSPQYHGVPTATTWIPDAQGLPFAVAIATSGHNNIYVYQLAERGEAPLLRQFRGHGARVHGLCASADQRYLASTSDDGTTRIWNLRGYDGKQPTQLRWGADFALEDDALVVRNLHRDSPLHFRGLRDGDVIRQVAWIDNTSGSRTEDGRVVRERQIDSPRDMIRALERNDWRTPVTFTYARGRDLVKQFQSLPAWQPLVSLVISTDQEWAYWTPAGYYDASFEGHRLFGWQFNRGLYLMPDFFLAAQLRASLERPAVMSRLLEAGTLDDAFQLSQQEVPANPQHAIVSAHRLRPRIEVITPQAGQAVEGSELAIEAHVLVRPGQTLIPPKAFANGVVAVERTEVSVETITQAGETWEKHHYRWQAKLPHDPQLLVQVVASTEQELADEATVELARRSPLTRKKSRLYLVTAGINQYRDRQVQSLDFAVNNAVQLSKTIGLLTAPLYQTHALSLLDQHMTRPMWDVALDHYASQLRQTAEPDDLLVIFLSGHGIKDPADDGYYYLTAESRLSDVLSRQYGDCLSFADFARLSDIPCRKLVVLDTCHSGAIQPLLQRELKGAVRALQNDMIMTLTASQGGQEAAEVRDRNLGRFTYHLLAGLRGGADQDRDGTVTLTEVSTYVQAMVGQESAGDDVPQMPTAGPSDLLRVASIPLTAPAKAQTAQASQPAHLVQAIP